MRRGSLALLVTALSILPTDGITGSSAFAADSPDAARHQRLLDVRNLDAALVLPKPLATSDRSRMDDRPRVRSLFGTLDVDTLPSPGIASGITTYDAQHLASQGHQVFRDPGTNTVHFVWTYWETIQDDLDLYGHSVNYNTWDVNLGQWNQGFDGVPYCGGCLEYGYGVGYPRGDVGTGNRAHLVLEQQPEPGQDEYSP
ncbi:MAG: hypothetical protein IIA44_12790, partial [Acidobacteria bacterium]|nr:hypothetical protein [Acidobacteriota bacterium]